LGFPGHFLHKILKRVHRVAAYKFGAIQFAYFGIPFLRDVLGPRGISNLINNERGGGIRVEYISDCLTEASTPISKIITWNIEPLDILPYILGINEEELKNTHHAHVASSTSNGSSCSSNDSGSQVMRSELTLLDAQLRSELINSEILSHAWSKGCTVRANLHCELQLIHYLEESDLSVIYQAIGTSKPVCWTCSAYLESLVLGKTMASDDEPSQKWWHSRGSGKIYSDWMVPPFGKDEIVCVVLDEAQREMERVTEEVAFDSYL
jgi:hypothetical protein